ncbi:MAG: ThiF family adenylyltransferase [Firmicutes bacterium]|nr:ThiF family adenylyltransferase [Dethiobacter sp.]MBS3887986.1 ThiF family adenylyltransferase [Bacillota bacterium]MBS4055248.1 ThiF family adenylyltransferase [Thermaerobacter sp.]
MNRYIAQTNIAFLGPLGQEKLSAATVTILGCGALGTVAADLLARAGVGRIRIIDRDVVELGNLQRQTLFVESDAESRIPKAEAATLRLQQINSDIVVEGLVADFTGLNALELLLGSDAVIDATDNYLARFTLNEACLALNLPWVYGGALGTGGALAVFTPQGPCFRCLFTELPVAGAGESCRTTGVLASVTTMVAALQVVELFKLLTGQAPLSGLLQLELTRTEFLTQPIPQDPACPACQLRRTEFLGQERDSLAALVCGQNSVLLPGAAGECTLLALAERLKVRGFSVDNSRFRLRIVAKDGYEVVVFADGRALVYGTSNIVTAKAVYNSILG